MSEVQSRGQSSRGRGSYRGGRGGYRGTRGGAKPHGRSEEQDYTPSIEDQGEVGELKAKYADKLPLLREVCEGWSDEDLVFALQESDGDVQVAIERITTGSVSQWGEVKKKSAKPKESVAASSDVNGRGRGRGSYEGRGRGRGSERGGRGSARGGRAVSQANGTRSVDGAGKTTEEALNNEAAVAATPATSESKPSNGIAAAVAEHVNEPGKDSLASLATDEPRPAAASAPGGKAKGWAGLFAKPPPVPAQKKISSPPSVTAPVVALEEPASIPTDPEPVPEPVHIPYVEPALPEEIIADLPSAPHSDSPAADIAPSQDKLTEKNLDKLPDTSIPPQSMTVASTTASTQDPMHPAVPVTPAVRPGMSGFAASALKATAATGRSASYSRKLAEQQEAVVMPGNHAVDRTAVQFGKMGLDADDVDADEEREEPETRTQLPDDSPAAPRASLPPAVPEAKAPVEAVVEEPPTQRPAPGLPPAPQQGQQHQPTSPQQTSSYADQYRYGQGQKSYDPFTQQAQAQGAGSEPFTNQVPGQSQTLPGSNQEFAQYYGNNRDAYQQYYGYSQGQDGQRTNSAFGTSAQESQAQYATARAQQGYSQPEAQTSGGNTPSATAATHQTPSQHLPSQGNYGGNPYGYPNAYAQQYPQYSGSYMANVNHRYGANRPMFDDVRRDNDYYGNQYSYGHNQQQYGNNYKSSMYGQPQHQYSHDYSSSPANNANFGGREVSYGRAGSTQPSEGQQSTSAGNNAFGGMADPFGRTPSGFGQTQSHTSHQASEEQSKASGPSPALQSGRPGSALNSMGSQQGSLPHPQSQHSNQGFGGYQQYGGFGNQSYQQQQHSGHSNYGSNAAFGGYGYGGRGGWAGYGAGQQH